MAIYTGDSLHKLLKLRKDLKPIALSLQSKLEDKDKYSSLGGT